MSSGSTGQMISFFLICRSIKELITKKKVFQILMGWNIWSKKIFPAPGGVRTRALRITSAPSAAIASTAYKYDALTDCATGAGQWKVDPSLVVNTWLWIEVSLCADGRGRSTIIRAILYTVWSYRLITGSRYTHEFYCFPEGFLTTFCCLI